MNDLIGWLKKNNRAARVARFLVQCFDVSLSKDDVQIWGSDDSTNSQK